MNNQQIESRAPASRRAVATVAALALAAIVVGTMLILADYTTTSAARSERRIAELAARVDALVENQKLIVAQLDAEDVRTGTVAAAGVPVRALPARTAVPLATSAAETNMGVNVALAKFTKTGVQTQAGWPVTINYGNYLDGVVGFNVAVSHGDVFQGGYYIDENTRTVEATLLRGAAVTVYGWERTGAGPARIAAADLVSARTRDDEVGRRWRSAWYWIKISRNGEILAAVETPPQ